MRRSRIRLDAIEPAATRTPLQTLARAALWTVEDGLVVQAATALTTELAYQPLPGEVVFMANLTGGKLDFGSAQYLVEDGQLRDTGGRVRRTRPDRPRTSAKSAEIRDRIPRAVEEYRSAVDRGSHSPTVDVAHALHVGRSTAARVLAAAREQGLLGPALRNRAGEGSS